jgi:cytochrome c-type biogenesis protein CcmH/NrfG
MALSLNGKFSKAYSRMAKSYMAIGKYTRALDAYKKALEVTPGNQELISEEANCRAVTLILTLSLSKCQENT